MVIIETTRNEQGEFVAKYVRESSLREEIDGFRNDLRNDFRGMVDDFRDDLREMLSRLSRALLVAGTVVTVAGSAGIYYVVTLAVGK